jgi:RES domain-containing protein
MIATRLKETAAYRVLVPKWSFAPTSGEGAGKHGGRANRPCLDALYLSLDAETALKEYKQVSSLLPPGLLVSYVLTVEPVVDFRSGYDAARWSNIWEDFFCDWREIWFQQHVEPPSWAVGDEVIRHGFKGILFQSRFAPQGTNLVIYPARFDENDSIAVYDPGNALPKNQESWK